MNAQEIQDIIHKRLEPTSAYAGQIHDGKILMDSYFSFEDIIFIADLLKQIESDNE